MRILFIFLIALFSSFSGLSQTWTSKNVSMTGTSPGYWEYLPSGYSDPANANRKYPVILFFHGSGANGNNYSQINLVLAEGLPKVINDGNFPASFTVSATEYKFIVIAPQVSWSGSVQNTEDIIAFIKANYRVDNSRFYLTGLSQGGEVVLKWAANSAGNAQKTAAMALACPSWYPTTPPAQILGDNDVPLWFYHNTGDPTINIGYTNLWVSEVNSFSPTPSAQKTTPTSNSHDAWTLMYDPNHDVVSTKNIYEWMLDYNRPNQADPNNPFKIVVLGSSTAAGTGASVTDSSWVKRLEKYYQQNTNDFLDTFVYNLGVSGTGTYNAQPLSFTPTGGRPYPDPTKNITYAMSAYTPQRIIINYPSNDIGFGYTNSETMDNLRRIKDTAASAGTDTWVLTTQPREDFNGTQQTALQVQRDSILLGFPGKAINVYDTLAAPDGVSFENWVDFGDGVHVDDDGHRYIFSKVSAGPIGETPGGGATGSPYTIPITRGMIINRNAVATKDLWRLFDGDLTTRIDANSVTDFRTGGSYPYKSRIILDSIYNITELNYRINTSNGNTISVKFFNASNAQVGDSVILNITGYLEWKNTIASRNGVRFIEFYAYSTAAVADGLTEVQFKGTATAAATFIYPSATITAPDDLGAFAHGINTIGDRFNKITQSGDTIMNKMIKAYRVYNEGSVYDIYPQTYDNRLINGPLYLGRYGNDHTKQGLDLAVARNHRPMVAKTGGSIKWLDATTANQNGTWLGGTIANQKRYTETTANPEIDTTYEGLAKQFRSLIALYGSNTGATIPMTVIGGSTTVGQNQTDIFETGNEESRWWQQDYYHTPKAAYLMQKALYDAGKLADPNAKIYMFALPGIDTMYWKAVWLEHYLAGGDVNNFPADGFNYNHYINNIKGEQQGSGDTYGISPEKWQTRQEMTNLKGFFDRMFPNKEVQWTEFGYATDDGSPYDVNPIGAKTDRQVQADFTLRLKALAQSVSFVQRMYYYAFFEDFTGPFNSMAVVQDVFNASSVYQYSTVQPAGYAMGQELYTEQWYKWFSTVLVNGDSTGVWVTRKDHQTDANKKLYKVWRGTDNGTTGNYTLTGLTGATSAKLYTQRYDRWLPDSTNLTISGTSVTFNVTEAMQWVEVSTSGTANNPPSANAGTDQTITLPTNSVSLIGGGTDSDGTISAYSWTKLSGGAATITTPTTVNTTVTGLAQGSYTFRLTVTDDDNATAFDDVNVTVNAQGYQTGDTIYIVNVKRTYAQTNGISQLYAVIDYEDNTVQYIYQKPASSETLKSVQKKNKTINGASRVTAFLKWTDNTSLSIDYKIY